jgi:hypothetical protein
VEYGLNKKPLRVRGVSQDITERKKTETEVVIAAIRSSIGKADFASN